MGQTELERTGTEGQTSPLRGHRKTLESPPAPRRKAFRLTRPVITESQLAKTVAEMLHYTVKEPAVWTHFPAGGGKLTPATAGTLKAWGLKPGMPDYLIFFNGRVIGIELKRETGVLSQAQKDMHPKLLAAGVTVYVCRTPEQVIEWLAIEGVPMRENFVKAILKGNVHGKQSTEGSSAA